MHASTYQQVYITKTETIQVIQSFRAVCKLAKRSYIRYRFFMKQQHGQNTFKCRYEAHCILNDSDFGFIVTCATGLVSKSRKTNTLKIVDRIITGSVIITWVR